MRDISGMGVEFLEELAQETARSGISEALTLLRDVIVSAQESGKTVYVAGNGGSCAAASHLANDLIKAGVRAIPLSDSAVLTAAGNDLGYEHSLDSIVQVWGKSGDVLVVFSASGSSPNIVNAIRVANTIGMRSFACCGSGGGKSRVDAHMGWWIGSRNYGVIESMHVIFCHLLRESLSAEK